jgi:hypothetical protein
MPSQGLDIEKNASALTERQRDDAWRRERVSVAAYYCAERRGFESGGEDADWREAQAQTDAADEAGE